ncbi:Bromodomain-containing protein [Microdochium nivale]|nr:Bromodomain-containing protein [Microdochium nivale]
MAVRNVISELLSRQGQDKQLQCPSNDEARLTRVSISDPHPMFVIVLVGPEEIPFGVHKDLVCAKSTFFSTHFEAQGNNQLEHIVKLPEVDPEVFGLAQNFMYTRAVLQADGEGHGKEAAPPGYDTLIALYHLGSKLDVHGLCAEALLAMRECRRITQHIPATPLLVQVWDDTPDGSPLRKLLLQWAAEYVRSSESREEFTKSLPHNVLSDLVVVMSDPEFGVVKNSSSSSQQGLPSRRRNDQEPEDGSGGGGDGVEWPAQPLKHRRSDIGRKMNGRKASRASLPTPLKPSKKQRINMNVAPDRPFSEEEKLVFCADLIGRMLSGPGFWTRLVGPFKDPVHPATDGVPDYYDKIARPMDLSTIKGKMDRGEYATAGDFAADVRQICSNCYAYHVRGNPTWEACTRFEEHFEKNFAGMDKWLLKMGGEEPA